MARKRSSIDLTDTLRKVKVPSFIAASDGTITWGNDAAKTMFGDLSGQPFTAVVAPEYAQMVKRQLERKLRGVPVTDYEVDVITRDGLRARAMVSSVPIPGDDPDRAVFAVALLDQQPLPAVKVDLTPRQQEVLNLLGQGGSTEQIAAELHVTTETVRNHIRHVLKALGAHSRLEAVVVARQQGLIRDMGHE